jgi:hypothetical protein
VATRSRGSNAVGYRHGRLITDQQTFIPPIRLRSEFTCPAIAGRRTPDILKEQRWRIINARDKQGHRFLCDTLGILNVRRVTRLSGPGLKK